MYGNFTLAADVTSLVEKVVIIEIAILYSRHHLLCTFGNIGLVTCSRVAIGITSYPAELPGPNSCDIKSC